MEINTENIVTRACHCFTAFDGSSFDLGYLHGLAYGLHFDNEYKTVLMLIDYLRNNISMEG